MNHTCYRSVDSTTVWNSRFIYVPEVEEFLNLQNGEDCVDCQKQHDGQPPGRSPVKELHKQGGHDQDELEPAASRAILVLTYISEA